MLKRLTKMCTRSIDRNFRDADRCSSRRADSIHDAEPEADHSEARGRTRGTGQPASQIWRHILSISRKMKFRESLQRSLKACPCRVLAAAAVFLLAAIAHAQTTASISGTVKDATDAVVAGAQIELTNEANRAKWDTKSNGEGFFDLAGIAPATYSLRVSEKGFEGWEVTGIVVHPGDNLTVPRITLKVGAAEISITVTTEAAGVTLDSPEHSTLINAEDIKRLSTQGRDVTELLNILPGFTVSNGQDMQNEGPGGIYGYQTMGFGSGNLGSLGANGAAPQQGLVNINSDGANLIDPGDMGGQVSNVNMDQVQEVKVETSNFSADQAKGPIVISAVGKSGGSQFHGGFYTYFRNSALNSNDALGKFFGQTRPPFRYYYPGATLGGPVLIPGTNFNHKKSLVFWAGFEYYGQNAPQFLATSFIPNAAMLGGNLSAATLANALNVSATDPVSGLTANCSADYSVTALYNNVGGVCTQASGTDETGATVAGGAGPAAGQLAKADIDPAMLAIANLWPAANRTPQPVVVNGKIQEQTDGINYAKDINATHNGFQLHTRVDESITDSLKLYGTFNWERVNDEAPLNNIYYNPNSTVPYPTPEYSYGHAYYLTLGLTKSFGATLTNELIASGVYYDQPKQFANPAAAQTTGTAWGAAGYSGGVNHLNEAQFPRVVSYETTGLPSLAFGYVPPSSEYLKKFDWNLTDNVTKIYKTHTFKAGAYVEDTGNSNLTISSNLNGQATFMRWDTCYINQTAPTSTAPVEANLGNVVGNFLMGCPLGYSQDNSDPVQDVRYRTYEGFLTDSWKVSSKLTLTLGMRLSHLEPWSDAHGIGMAVWDPSSISQNLLYPDSTANTTWPGVFWHQKNPQIPNAGVPTRALFYVPRVGLAYDLYGNGKTVFRGGWGMYYSHDSVGIAGSALASASGLQTFSTPGNVSCSMRQLFNGNLSVPFKANPQEPYVGCGYYSSTPTSITPFLLSAMDPKDDHMPLTYNYNFTLDQQGPWKTAIEIAYVGNQSTNLSTLGNLQNQNVIPLGAMFKPDPCSGCADSGVTYTPTTIPVSSDYRPYPNYTQVNVANHIVWANYNALQAAWNRQTGGFIYGANYTWSKAMGVRGNYDTGSIADPIDPHHDYGVLGFDRPEVFNLTYSYTEGKKYNRNRVLGQALNGWEISGILQVQSGMDLAVANAGTNFGLGSSSSGINFMPAAGGLSQSIPVAGAEWLGSSDYSLQPTVTCDPRSHLNKNQFVNGSCFGLPALGTQGWWNLPDVHGPAYFKWDMSVYKDFAITEKQKMQFRVSGFNFLNHPLTSFNNNNLGSLTLAAGDCWQPNLTSCPTYTTAAQALQNVGISNASNFGYAAYKNGVRIVELAFKYDF